ncbi:MAG: hypothetical protein II142_07095 [Bacteroidales bacterium]|jgi:hypothetical protein|nr:hypothetical protein [Bacteroidales bacterium]SKC61211.1 hypothetical protein SAMN06298215_1956 [Bacteroidales bacterium WCE2008]
MKMSLLNNEEALHVEAGKCGAFFGIPIDPCKKKELPCSHGYASYCVSAFGGGCVGEFASI